MFIKQLLPYVSKYIPHKLRYQGFRGPKGQIFDIQGPEKEKYLKKQ